MIRRLAFRSFVDYAASVAHAALDVRILAREERPWRIDRCRLGEVLLEHGVEGAPFVADGSTARGTVGFYFSAGPGDGRSLDFHDVDEGVLCRLAGGSRLSLAVRRPGEWFALTASGEAVAAVAAELGPGSGEDLGRSAALRGAPERLAGLRELAGSALLAAAEGRVRAGPEASTSLGRTLLAEALRASRTASQPGRGVSRVRIGRQPVLGRLGELLRRRGAEPLYVADLCEATGLPERTLRYVVAEQYGTSPVRLLRSRRLCHLYRTLRAAEGSDQGVAAIASRCGFRHMGQLAADYRSLFGELPSETLRRARDGQPVERHVPEPRPAVELREPA